MTWRKRSRGARSGSILTRVTGERITRSPIFIWKLESLRKQPRMDARPCALIPRLLLPIQTTQAHWCISIALTRQSRSTSKRLPTTSMPANITGTFTGSLIMPMMRRQCSNSLPGRKRIRFHTGRSFYKLKRRRSRASGVSRLTSQTVPRR